MGGIGFVGARYYEDTVSGRLSAAREHTMSGQKQRGDTSYVPAAADDGASK
jgi:hypothetical protein